MTATATTPTAAGVPGAAVPRRRRTQGEPRRSPVFGLLAWAFALLFVTPVAWMVLTSLHSEADAATNPPSIFAPLTLDQYELLLARGLTAPLLNSAMASVMSTLLVLVLAIPAAYALSIRPVQKWTDVMFFFLSTKFLPLIAGLLPIYLIVKEIGMLDNVYTLVILYTAMNLPIAVWMMQSFLAEIPIEMVEAAQVDGAKLATILARVIAPVAAPGIAATALICFIFSWNEFMLAVNLTAVRAGTAPVFLVGFITSEGLFWARLSAASTMAVLPVIIAGWIAQKWLVRGLSLGAVK